MGEVLAGVAADIWITSTPGITLSSSESCTDSGDHIVYIANTHIFWDWTKPFTVQCSPNGSTSWVTATDYIVLWAAGRIKFNTARTSGVNNFVRISAGDYFPATQLQSAYSWTYTPKVNSKDSTCFQAPGAWASSRATTKSGSGKIDSYRNDDRMHAELSNLLGMQLFINKSLNARFQFFARHEGGAAKSPATALQEQEFNFTVVRDAYLLTS